MTVASHVERKLNLKERTKKVEHATRTHNKRKNPTVFEIPKHSNRKNNPAPNKITTWKSKPQQLPSTKILNFCIDFTHH